MNSSEVLDDTFAKDRAFCDQMISSANASELAKMMLYHKWAQEHFTEMLRQLIALVPRHFAPADSEDVKFWTFGLAFGAQKDLGFVPYLTMRGLVSEVGGVLRRALEHVGVLTHLWKDPSKASTLASCGAPEFKSAFENQRLDGALRQAGVKPRFAALSSIKHAVLASEIYSVISNFSVHGGTPANVIGPEWRTPQHSCALVRRETPTESELSLVVAGCALVCFELAILYASHAKKYGESSVESGSGLKLLLELLDDSDIRDYSDALLDLLRKSKNESHEPAHPPTQ